MSENTIRLSQPFDCLQYIWAQLQFRWNLFYTTRIRRLRENNFLTCLSVHSITHDTWTIPQFPIQDQGFPLDRTRGYSHPRTGLGVPPHPHPPPSPGGRTAGIPLAFTWEDILVCWWVWVSWKSRERFFMVYVHRLQLTCINNHPQTCTYLYTRRSYVRKIGLFSKSNIYLLFR